MSYIALKPSRQSVKDIEECSPSVVIVEDLHCTLAHFRTGPKISEEAKKNLQKVFDDYLAIKSNIGWPVGIKQLGTQEAKVWTLILDQLGFIGKMRGEALKVLSLSGIEVSSQWEYNPHITLTSHPLIVFAQNIPEKIFFDQLVFVE